jgi:type IV pilus assembly protein PilC
MYPAFLLAMAVSATIFLLGFVLPKFAKIYESRQAVLPAPTRLLLGISDGLVGYWDLWAGLVITAALAFVVVRRTAAGRRAADFLKLNAPILGRIFRQLYISRACRTMGTLISAGVSMLDTVALIKQVTGNSYFDDLWDKVNERLQQGSQLSEPLFNSPLIPKSIAQMIFSGEKSGRLGQVMARVAEFTESEFDLTVKTATQFIEPVIIGVMGALIGFIAISLLLPIFSIGKVMASG